MGHEFLNFFGEEVLPQVSFFSQQSSLDFSLNTIDHANAPNKFSRASKRKPQIYTNDFTGLQRFIQHNHSSIKAPSPSEIIHAISHVTSFTPSDTPELPSFLCSFAFLHEFHKVSSIFNVHTSTNNPQTLSLGDGAVLRLSGLMVGRLIGEISC